MATAKSKHVDSKEVIFLKKKKILQCPFRAAKDSVVAVQRDSGRELIVSS